MRWTALNGVGAVFWIAALYLAGSVPHAGPLHGWTLANPLIVAGAFGLIGLGTLVWANLIDI